MHWEALHTFNPAAIVRQGKVYVFYRAEDDSGTMVIGMHTSRLGLASSDDGIHFTTEPSPVFYPDVDSQKDREWPGGVEDPRLVESEDGTYVLTYTQWNRRNTDIGIATSTDLIHWTKHGPALVGEKYQHFDYKSASIVTRLTDGRLIAAKDSREILDVLGRDPGAAGNIAGSDSLDTGRGFVRQSHSCCCTIARDTSTVRSLKWGRLRCSPITVLSSFTTARMRRSTGRPELRANAYSDGQALFSADDPRKLVSTHRQAVFQA